jgi:class 3 adenylate cyclase
MYLINDIVAKVSINTLFTNNLLKIENLRNNMDLQTINFTSYMLNNINQYYENNSIITKECSNFIENIRNNFITVIPKNKDVIKIELLNKILPLNLVNKYIFDNKNNTKHYTNICVLFTDIVNYTELAKNYKHDIIFELLNILYTKFDNIIKKYSHLQKIETIGDAYMVVGDIFRNDDNYKIVIKEIILIAFDFINEIKNIKTPDKNPLSIRIGINLGNVSIGILGTELPRLCVVGNTVNMASRLQSTADPDTIQISHHIYEQLEEMDLKNKFEICKKENVFLKNIGSVTTYIVTPIILN